MVPVQYSGEEVIIQDEATTRKSCRESRKQVERLGFQGTKKINSVIKAGLLGITCFALHQHAHEAKNVTKELKAEVEKFEDIDIKSIATVAEETFIHHSTRLDAIKMLDFESDDNDATMKPKQYPLPIFCTFISPNCSLSIQYRNCYQNNISSYLSYN